MSNQRTFDDAPQIVSPNESHMALLFLLDVSGSMSGAPITSLNESINKFKEQVCQDARTTQILDVAIVTFNHETQVVMPFSPVAYMEPVALTASGGTEIAPAVETAINMVQDRSRFYRHSGTEPYKPWIFMISDGFGGDVTAVSEQVRQLEDGGYLKFFSLGVEGYDSKTLHQLCGEKVMKLNGYDFTGILNWAQKSMRTVSVSSPGDKLNLPPLPDNVDKDVNDWF